jgi:hypothetical protein
LNSQGLLEQPGVEGAEGWTEMQAEPTDVLVALEVPLLMSVFGSKSIIKYFG